MVFNRFYFLFGPLVSAVSACSAPGCGNECGQKRFLPRASDVSPVLGGKRFAVGLLDFAQLLSGVQRHPLIPELRIVIGLCTAHPAGAMDLALCETSRSPPRPCVDVLFPANLPEKLFLPMNGTLTLLAIVTAVSVQL